MTTRWSFLLFVALALAMVLPCLAWAAADSAGDSEAEKWVIEQLSAGQAADLIEKYPDEGNRMLRAAFLEEILIGRRPEIQAGRYGIRLRGAIFAEPLNLYDTEIREVVRLEECRFDGGVDFSRTTFDRDVTLNGSVFSAAAFARVRAAGSLYLKDARFLGGALFQNADVAGQLQVDGARFESPEQPAMFDGAQVGGSALFNNTVFAGPATFVSADVRGQFQADAAQFTFNQAPASFNGLRIGGIAWINDAVFAGGADFRGLEVEGQFRAEGANFAHPERPAQFKGARVANSVTFRKTRFAGPAILTDVSFVDLAIEGPDEQTTLPLLDLTRAEVQREMRIENLHVRDLAATSLRVQGPAYLSQVQVERLAGLERARFETLTLTDVTWPDESGALWLTGMTYDLLSAGAESDSPHRLLDLAGRAEYSVQVYTDLEDFFRRQGLVEWADRTYIAQRRRERSEVLPVTSLAWWWNAFLDVFVLFGRGPGRAFLWSFLLVLIGAFLFRRKEDMIPVRPEEGADYSPFWYSLDLFLPFVDLQIAGRWNPRPGRRLVRHYLRVHALLGWLLIPIGLLAVTGTIR